MTIDTLINMLSLLVNLILGLAPAVAALLRLRDRWTRQNQGQINNSGYA